jgi:hypothetical protein
MGLLFAVFSPHTSFNLAACILYSTYQGGFSSLLLTTNVVKEGQSTATQHSVRCCLSNTHVGIQGGKQQAGGAK